MANSNFVIHNGLTVGPLTVDAATGDMIARNILPTDTLAYNLGSLEKQWHSVYVGPGSLYVNGQKVLQDESGTIVMSADLNQNISVQTSGSGDIILDPVGTGVVSLRGPVQMQAGSNFVSSDGNAISFVSPIATDAILGKSINTDLILSANGTGTVKVDDTLTVTGDLIVTGTTTNLSVTNLTVQDNIIDLAGETTGTPTANAGIRIVRGDEPAVQLRWNETADKWQFTNDGVTYQDIQSANSSGDVTVTGILAGPAVFVIDPAAVGDNTGVVVIKGDLQVDGTTVTVNSATMTVADKNITVASGAANAAAADGAGITVAGASATMLYTSATDTFNFNKGLVSATVEVSNVIYTPAVTYRNATSTSIADEYVLYINSSSTTANQVLDTILLSKYSSVKYIIEASTATQTEIVESTLAYTSTDVYQNDTTIIATSAELVASYAADIVNGSLRFLGTPTNVSTQFKIKAIAFRKI
jgi:hypothetical protein